MSLNLQTSKAELLPKMNVFPVGRKTKSDSTNSLHRFLELKRDPTSRVKHLKLILESIATPVERRTFLEEYHFEVFHLLLDLFLQVDHVSTPLSSTNNRSAIEVEFSLWTLEQIFTYLPDMVAQKWQYRAIEQNLKKCLYPQNLMALRKIAMRLFLLWYQILGSNGAASPDLDKIFICLLPYFPLPQGQNSEKMLENQCKGVKMDFDLPKITEVPLPIQSYPLAPQLEKQESEMTAKRKCQKLQSYIDKFFDYMTRETTKLEWKSHKIERQRLCLEFLFNKLKTLYMPACFPNQNEAKVDIYSKEGLAGCRSFEEIENRPLVSDPQSDPVMVCRYWLIRLIAHYGYSYKHSADSLNNTHSDVALHHEMALSSPERKFTIVPDAKLPASYDVMKMVLFGSRENINMTLTLLREGLLVPLQCQSILSRVFRILREWIFMDEVPPFMREPDSSHPLAVGTQSSYQTLLNILISFYFNPATLGDFDKLTVAVQISHKIMGLLKDLANPQRTPTLEFSQETWTMYLNCLLRVVAKVVPPVPPIPDPTQKNFSQEVATSMFQALTISWIFVTGVRGVNISENLWDRLYETLSERTSWPELIEEWSKVLESVTRALGVNFYGVDLHDLPLERMTKKDIIKQKDPVRPDPPVSLNLQSESKEQYNFVQPTPTPTQVTHGGGDIPLNVSEPNLGRLSAGDHDFQTPLSAPPYVVANDAHENRFDGNEMKIDHHSADGTSLDDTASLDSNSLGLLSNEIDGNAHSPMFASASDNNSLTHSPTHSVTALDDSVDDYDLAPEQIDSAEVDLTPRDPDSDSASNSTVTWVTVWRRVLGCLGNINSISKPANHAKAVRALNKTIDSLIKVRANQGIPSDQSLVNQYVPPFLWFAPWLLSVVKMPKEFNESRSMAIQSICRILLHQQDQPVEEGLAAEFIAIMGNVLKDPDTKMVTVALESLCPEILYEKVPGLCAVLIKDCLEAAKHLVNTNLSIKAVHLGACLACFEHRAIDGAQELREQAVELLLMAAKSTSLDRKAKSLTLNGLSIYVFEETTRLGANATKKLLNDAFNCLLYELMSENDFKLGLQVAENLHSLLYVIPTIISPSTQQLPFIVKLLLELYCNQLESLANDSGAVELSIRLMVDLCEFCLKIPVHLLTHKSGTHTPPLHWVLKALTTCWTDHAVIPQLKVTSMALLPLLMKSFGQCPLPELPMAQFGCMDEHLDDKKCLDQSWVVAGTQGKSIWCVDSRNRDCQFIVRSLSAKHGWAFRENCDSEVKKENEVNKKLNDLVQNFGNSTPKSVNRSETEEKSLNKLCQHLAESSPECLPHPQFPEPALDTLLPSENEITQSLNQFSLKSSEIVPVSQVHSSDTAWKDIKCWRNLLADLGLTLWDHRDCLTRLDTDDIGRISRELRLMDNLVCREVHKIAVLYVAEGQEDKVSILKNSAGSKHFEDFLARLGWEVDLTCHPGYQGGLPAVGASPYFATANCEVMFHVSSRMQVEQFDKLKHLGNDEIHIVWSEHWRDYRRSIIATQFCDVLIAIYPLPNKLYRIQILSVYGLNFGPLFDGAIVSWASLAPLVRATAINANRARRRSDDGWQHWDERRFEVVKSTLANLERTSLFSDLVVNLTRPTKSVLNVNV